VRDSRNLLLIDRRKVSREYRGAASARGGDCHGRSVFAEVSRVWLDADLKVVFLDRRVVGTLKLFTGAWKFFAALLIVV